METSEREQSNKSKGEFWWDWRCEKDQLAGHSCRDRGEVNPGHGVSLRETKNILCVERQKKEEMSKDVDIVRHGKES